MSLFFFFSPCFCKIAWQLPRWITLYIHSVHPNRGNRKLLLKPAYLRLLFLIHRPCIKRYSEGTRRGVGCGKKVMEREGDSQGKFERTVVSYVVMEWQQLSPRRPPPPTILSCCPAPWTAVPPQHTLALARTGEAAKGLIHPSAVEDGCPSLSWWWLWQRRTPQGRLRSVYSNSRC